MSYINAESRLTDNLLALLPLLRRHARTLTGSQAMGDGLAAATLQAIVDNPKLIAGASSLKVGLFLVFAQSWKQEASSPPQDKPAAQVQARMNMLTPYSRQALLLRAVEDFTQPQIAEILQITQFDVADLIMAAQSEMQASGKVMMIVDEVMVAMDLYDMVSSMGHAMTVATLEQAPVLAQVEYPDLILSDLQLASGPNGIAAVDAALQAAKDVPVVLMTSTPGRLLTGDHPEPTFVIGKPCGEEKIQAIISQAMLFRNGS